MTGHDPERLLRLEAQMRIAGARWRRAVHARAAAVDPSLGRVAYGVLELVNAEGPARQAELCCRLEADKGAVSRGVQQLLDLGLVERVADPDDGRSHRVAVSNLGRQRLEAVAELRRTAYAERLSGWSDAGMEAFIALMTRYNDDLES